jgi:hypothetical protein
MLKRRRVLPRRALCEIPFRAGGGGHQQVVERDPSDRYESAESFVIALEAAQDAAPASAPKAAPRSSRRASASIGAAAVALIAVSGAALLRSARSAPIDAHRVLVALFENRTGDVALDPIADIATDYVARGLTETRLISDVYDAHTQRLMRGDTLRPRAGADLTMAKTLRAGTVVRGSYFVDADSLHFEARSSMPRRSASCSSRFYAAQPHAS